MDGRGIDAARRATFEWIGTFEVWEIRTVGLLLVLVDS
jgi:hypothetical protein